MVSLRHLSELCNGDVTSLHRGIWQHHRVTAIRIKFSFKSLVQNYEPKSRRMALELKDLEQANMNWSHPNVNAATLALQLEQQVGCSQMVQEDCNGVALGTLGTGDLSTSSRWCWEQLGAHKVERRWMDPAASASGTSVQCCPSNTPW